MDELLGNPGVTFIFGMLLMAVIIYIGDNKKKYNKMIDQKL